MEDVLNFYRGRKEVASKKLKVIFDGEEGSDHGGLTRDMLSMFWTEASSVYFAGNGALVPRIPLHKQRALKGDYPVLGTILSHTACLAKVIPPRLSRTFLVLIVFGDAVSDDCILSDFLDFVTVSERALLKRALKDFSALSTCDKSKLMDIYSMYEMYETPSAESIQQQLLSIAEATLVDKCRPLIDEMRKGIPSIQMDMFWKQLSIQMIDFIFISQSPNGKKVAAIVKACSEDLRPQEESVLWWLKDFIASLDSEDVADFLRFTTGSSVMPQQPIQVEFLPAARYPVARTCSNLIQCPVHYASRNELKREWRSILCNPNSFEMSLM